MDKCERHDVLDLETGNLYGRFPTEEAALEFVRDMIDANGRDIVDSLAVGGRDGAGMLLPVQTGAALARRATREQARQPTLSRHT